MISLVSCKVRSKATLLPSVCGFRRPKCLQTEIECSCDHIKILLGCPSGDLRAISPVPGEAQFNTARPPSPPQAIHTDLWGDSHSHFRKTNQPCLNVLAENWKGKQIALLDKGH